MAVASQPALAVALGVKCVTSRARGRLSFNFAGFFYDPFGIATAQPYTGLFRAVFSAQAPEITTRSLGPWLVMVEGALPYLEFSVPEEGESHVG